MKRIALALIVGLAGMSAVVAVGQSPDGPVGKDRGLFHAECTFSHRLPDDPIVFPGQPGRSHSHDFVGYRETDAFATNISRRVAHTCAPRGDRSAYWFPTLYVDGQPVPPAHVGITYRSGRRDLSGIVPFPWDFRMLAGRSSDSSPPNPTEGRSRVLTWECGAGLATPGSLYGESPPACRTLPLTATIVFPDCWDGEHSDSPDHRSHVAYARSYSDGVERCPASHPVELPIVEIIVRYDTTLGPSGRLASGTLRAMHADFLNGWEPAALGQRVRDCLVADRYCFSDGVPLPLIG